MSAFLSAILYVISFNLMGLLFFSAALYFARRGRTFWHWYIIGLFLQGYSVFGTILGMVKVPDQWQTANNYLSIAFFVLLAAILFFLLKKEEHRIPIEDRKRSKQKKS